MKMRVFAIFYQDVEIVGEQPYGKHYVQARDKAQKRKRQWKYYDTVRITRIVGGTK